MPRIKIKIFRFYALLKIQEIFCGNPISKQETAPETAHRSDKYLEQDSQREFQKQKQKAARNVERVGSGAKKQIDNLKTFPTESSEESLFWLNY